MKKYISLLLLLSVAACASTSQGKLRQVVYDMNSTYHVLASPMILVMSGQVPGIKLTDTQISLVKRASQTVFNELSSLNNSVQTDKNISETTVMATQTNLSSLLACWTGIKSGSTPAECTALAESK